MVSLRGVALHCIIMYRTGTVPVSTVSLLCVCVCGGGGGGGGREPCQAVYMCTLA